MPMTTIGMHYDVIPGKEQEFENGFASTLEFLKTQPGHLESRLFEDVQSPGSYLIFSQWQSKADLDAFLHSDAFRKAVAWGRAEILRGRPKHTVYTEG
jgi:heme oxygenase (staphylobilin-producing)